MKRIIIQLLNWLSKKRLSKKVCCIGDQTILYYTAKISLTQKATKENIKLSNNSRVYGSLVSCGKGKIIMGEYAALGAKSAIKAVNSIEIGAYTAIAPNVIIQDNNTHPVNPNDRLKMRITPSGHISRSWLYSDSAPIKIGKNCWIGENSRICKGVTIGDGSIVAANSVVTHDVPENSIAAGNPAKIVKTDIHLNSKEYFKKWPELEF